MYIIEILMSFLFWCLSFIFHNPLENTHHLSCVLSLITKEFKQSLHFTHQIFEKQLEISILIMNHGSQPKETYIPVACVYPSTCYFTVLTHTLV